MNSQELNSLIKKGEILADNQNSKKFSVKFAEFEKFQSNISLNIDQLVDNVKELNDIANKISEVWQGIDSDCYIEKMQNYNDRMKNTVITLDQWDIYFKKCLKMFFNIKDESLNKVRDLDVIFSPKKDEILDEQFGGE